MAVPKLRFKAEDGSDFPEWENNILGNYSYLRGRIGFRGYTKNDIVSKEQGGVAALSPTNIVDSCICFRNATYVTREKYEESPEIKLQEKDILFVKTGSTLGKFGYINILEEEATVNPQMVVITALECNPYFLFLALNEKNAKEFVSKIKVGGAVPTLSQEELKKLPIRIPCRNEQQKIADFLSTIDSIISSQKEELAVWEQRKKGIMQKLFSQEVRFKADDGSEFPDWEEKRLNEITVYERHRSEGRNFVGTENMIKNFGGVKFDRLNSAEVGIEYHIGDTLMSNIRPYLKKAWLADRNGICSSDVLVFHPINVDPTYLYHIIASDTFVFAVMQSAKGSKMPRGDKKQIMEMVLPLPVSDEQEKIADCLSSIDEVINKEKEELEKWQELKKGLLQQMFV